MDGQTINIDHIKRVTTHNGFAVFLALEPILSALCALMLLYR